MIILETVLLFLNGFHVQLAFAGLLFWRHLKLRIPRIAAAAILVAYCVVPSALQTLLPSFQASHAIPDIWTQSYYLIAVAFGVVYWGCFRFTGFKDFLFYYVPAIVIQHSLHDITTLASHLLPALPGLGSGVLGVALMALVYLVYDVLFIWRIPDGNGLSSIQNTYLIPFTFFAAFLVYGLSVWTRANESFTYGAYLFDLICCVLTLIVHFGKFTQSKLEREKEVILRILQGEQEKHRLSTQTIEMINRKTHDLKYQIASLKNMSRTEQQTSISNLEKAVNFYDNVIKTGNETLDVLLYERSLSWDKYGISFTCIADGSKLSFMRPEDIYALFGNALDNAIESVQSIEEADKRIINLNIVTKGNIVLITVSNYYQLDLTFDGALPVTTKPDKEYHGYGIKSMRYLAEKYGGTLSIQAQNGIFKLIIMLPVQKDDPAPAK